MQSVTVSWYRFDLQDLQQLEDENQDKLEKEKQDLMKYTEVEVY